MYSQNNRTTRSYRSITPHFSYNHGITCYIRPFSKIPIKHNISIKFIHPFKYRPIRNLTTVIKRQFPSPPVSEYQKLYEMFYPIIKHINNFYRNQIPVAVLFTIFIICILPTKVNTISVIVGTNKTP